MKTVHQATLSVQPRDESAREIQELRDNIEQAIACINAALYVLLVKVDASLPKTEELKASKVEACHEQA